MTLGVTSSLDSSKTKNAKITNKESKRGQDKED